MAPPCALPRLLPADLRALLVLVVGVPALVLAHPHGLPLTATVVSGFAAPMLLPNPVAQAAYAAWGRE